MRPQVRSLNLASTVNTVVYEAVRQVVDGIASRSNVDPSAADEQAATVVAG